MNWTCTHWTCAAFQKLYWQDREGRRKKTGAGHDGHCGRTADNFLKGQTTDSTELLTHSGHPETSQFGYQHDKSNILCSFHCFPEMATMCLTRPVHRLDGQLLHTASDLMNSLSISTHRDAHKLPFIPHLIHPLLCYQISSYVFHTHWLQSSCSDFPVDQQIN